MIQHIKQLIVHHVNVSRNDSDIDDSDTNSFLYGKTAKWIDMLFSYSVTLLSFLSSTMLDASDNLHTKFYIELKCQLGIKSLTFHGLFCISSM